MSKKNFSKFVNGKGYYIALVLCAVAIGVSGYLYYRNADTGKTQLQNPTTQTDNTGNKDVQAVATEPNGELPTTQPTGHCRGGRDKGSGSSRRQGH